MINPKEGLGRSVQAVYRMWKAKLKPATFPAIPVGMEMAEKYEFINQWLFNTGYLNPRYYRDTYEQCEEVSEDETQAMLGEIFCN